MSHRRSEGQSAERAVGEKRLVKGTYPHITPVVSRRPLTTPALATTSPHPVTSRAGLNPGRHHVRANVDITDTIVGGNRSTPSPWDNLWYIVQPRPCAGGRRVRRQSPPLPPPSPRHHSTPCSTQSPRPAPAPMSPTFSPVISTGSANNPICHTPGASGQQDRCDELPRSPRDA